MAWKEYNPSWNLLISLIIIGFIDSFYYDYYKRKLLNQTVYNKIVNNEYVIDMFMKSLMKLLNNKSQKMSTKNHILLYGFVETHLKECHFKDCLLKKKQLYYIPYKNMFIHPSDYDQRSPNIKFILILSYFNFFLNYCFSTTIVISYATYQLDVIGNLVKLRSKIDQIDLRKCTIQQSFSIYKLKLMANLRLAESLYDTNSDAAVNKENYISLSDQLENKDEIKMDESPSIGMNGNLKLVTVIKYYYIISKFKKLLNQAANDNYQFWGTFAFKSLNNNLYNKGINLHNQSIMLHRLFEKLKTIYLDFEIKKSYSDYIKFVVGDHREAELVLQAKSNENVLNKNSLVEVINKKKNFYFSHDSTIVMARFMKEKSIIEKVTESIANVFGYTPNQLLGKELETLIPPFFQKHHHSFVNFHTETGVKRVIGVERYLYAYHKNQYIFPIKLNVMIIPNIEKVSYMGCIQKMSEEEAVILVEPNGKIDSLTKTALNKLKLQHNFFIEKDIYIYHLCVNYIKDRAFITKFNPDEFSMKSSINERLTYCRNMVLIEQIKETIHRTFLKSNKKKSSKSKKIEELIKKIDSSTDQAKLIDIDTEIDMIHFNEGLNENSHTLMILKLTTEEIGSEYNETTVQDSLMDGEDEEDFKEEENNFVQEDSKEIVSGQANDLESKSPELERIPSKNYDKMLINNEDAGSPKDLKLHKRANAPRVSTMVNLNDHSLIAGSPIKTPVKNIIKHGSKTNKRNPHSKYKAGSEPNHPGQIVKDYNLNYRRQSHENIVALIENNKSPDKKKKKEKNKSAVKLVDHDVSSYGNLFSSSHFYNNYIMFKKRLYNDNANKISNQKMQIFNLVLVVVLIGISIYRAIQHMYSNSLLGDYYVFSNQYSNFFSSVNYVISSNNKNIINKNISNLINNKLDPKDNLFQPDLYKTSYQAHLTEVYNDLYSLKAYNENPLISYVNDGIMNFTTLIMKAPEDDKTSLKYSISQDKIMLSNFYLLLRSLDYTFFKIYNLKSGEVISQNDKNWLNFIQLNFFDSNIYLYKGLTQMMTDSYTAYNSSFHLPHILILSAELFVILISYSIVFYMMVLIKKKQVALLDSFFQIKNNDAIIQKGNCKLFLEAYGSMRANINYDSEEGIAKAMDEGKKDKKGKNSLELIELHEEKQNLTGRDNKEEDKKKATKKKKDENIERSAEKHKSEFEFTSFQIYSYIASVFVILYTSAIPLTSYFNSVSAYTMTNDYFGYLSKIQLLTISTQSAFLECQNLVLNPLEYSDIFISRTSTALESKYDELKANFTDFSNFTLNIPSSLNSELINLLNSHICTSYIQYSVDFPDCEKYASMNSIQGLSPHIQNIISNIFQIIQTYKNNPTEFIKQFYTSKEFMNLIDLYERIGFSGFEVMRKILLTDYNSNINDLGLLIIVFVCLYCGVIVFDIQK